MLVVLTYLTKLKDADTEDTVSVACIFPPWILGVIFISYVFYKYIYKTNTRFS